MPEEIRRRLSWFKVEDLLIGFHWLLIFGDMFHLFSISVLFYHHWCISVCFVYVFVDVFVLRIL